MTDRPFTVRPATADDIPAIRALMDAAIPALLAPYLSEQEVAASYGIMGLDTTLIEDGTYFVVEEGANMVGCGGWSRRATLYGGDHTPGRNAALLDPAKDAARVRAMYTHPGHTRRGIGRLVLDHCEAVAATEGFGRYELVATLSGEPLYRACGYEERERFDANAAGDTPVPGLRMTKPGGTR